MWTFYYGDLITFEIKVKVRKFTSMSMFKHDMPSSIETLS